MENLTIPHKYKGDKHTSVELNQTVDKVNELVSGKVDGDVYTSGINSKIDNAEKGVANGVATLDAGAKLTTSQVPDSLVGGMVYQGTWEADTNTPTIPAAAAGNKGYYHVVSVAGTTDVDGIAVWAVGDWIVSSGAVWEKVENTQSVNSVAGKTGAVILEKADVNLPNVDNTSDANKTVSTLQAASIATKLDKSPSDNVLYGQKNGVNFEIVGIQTHRSRHEATAGQTTFSAIYNIGGEMDVYWAGTLLDEVDDYVATTGTSIVLNSPANLGDIIKIRIYG